MKDHHTPAMTSLGWFKLLFSGDRDECLDLMLYVVNYGYTNVECFQIKSYNMNNII